MKNRTWCHVVAIAATIGFSNFASAGLIGIFDLDAEGDYLEDGDTLSITAPVVGGFTDLPVTFQSFDALLTVDPFGDPESFIGEFTLTSDMGDIFATTTGSIERQDLPGGTGERISGLSGLFEIIDGTGFFADLGGGGVLTALGIGGIAGDMSVQLAGFVVPAPASFALIGAAGLMTRRRRR